MLSAGKPFLLIGVLLVHSSFSFGSAWLGAWIALAYGVIPDISTVEKSAFQFGKSTLHHF